MDYLNIYAFNLKEQEENRAVECTDCISSEGQDPLSQRKS